MATKIDAETLLIAERAAEWLIRLETATPEECAEFSKWLSESPLHVREMLAAQATDAELRRVFQNQHFDANEFLQQANVHEIADHHRPFMAASVTPFGRLKGALASTRGKLVAAAAFMALITAAIITIQMTSDDRRLMTEAGELQTKRLSDGTIVRAGPRTKLIIEFTSDERTVRLVRGEAMFYVARQPDRPFFVRTELAIARAVGTAFEVSDASSKRDANSKQVRVTVKEGVVEVSRPAQTPANAAHESITLHAAEQIEVMETGPLASKQVDIDIALAWVNGEVIFVGDDTIEEAVRQLNRRSKTQIVVSDREIAQRAVRGTFSAIDPREFTTHLERNGIATVVEQDGKLYLVAYPQSDETLRKQTAR